MQVNEDFLDSVYDREILIFGHVSQLGNTGQNLDTAKDADDFVVRRIEQIDQITKQWDQRAKLLQGLTEN